MKIQRGDILFANLGRYQGSVQGGNRPVVVISNNRVNRYSTVITVVPLSTKVGKKKNLPTHVFVPASSVGGPEHDSIALCEQVISLDVENVQERIGRLEQGLLDKVTEAVQIQIGVFEEYN
ncbi:MAG: type II toxin-antitoxin system PemK/MazF family toxin [Lachnospiraceae bacterium]|nr:type II toxin-antitoxin system PemK/MazF family toxin [Lachnospiraceae bacterium]